MVRRQDYRCPSCGRIARDVLVPDGKTSAEAAPFCPNLCQEYRALGPYFINMEWLPSTRAMDVGGVKTAAFTGFDTFDNRGTPVHVDSLHKLRRVERDSEKMAADGIGSPMVWRDFSQSASNRDRHTLTGHDPAGMADPHGVRETIRKAKGKFPAASGEAVTAVHGEVPVEG